MYKRKKNQPYYTNRHSCFLLQYHIVLVTKYRKPILIGPVKEMVYRLIQEVFDDRGLNLLEIKGEPDHIHILYESDPFTSPGELVNVLKSKTSRYTRKEYGGTLLKKYYSKPIFWSQSYFVTTAGNNAIEMVRAYTRDQQDSAEKC